MSEFPDRLTLRYALAALLVVRVDLRGMELGED